MRTLIVRGQPFYTHDNEDISNAMHRDNDFYEDHILDYFYNLFPTHGIIIDVGANIGNHTIYFARYLTYDKILSFEPISDNFELLRKNTELYPNIEIYQKALSNYHGKIKMARHSGNFGCHSVTEEGAEELECITLDSLNLQNVTLIKLDVEFHEPQVLEGAAKTIERCKPLLIIEDVYQQYNALPQLQGYKLIMGWNEDFTYIYKWVGTSG